MIQIATVILLTVIAIKELLSFNIGKDDYSKTTKELSKQFWRRDILLLFLTFLFIPLFTVLLTVFFDWLSKSLTANDEGIIHIIKPEIGMWFVLALMSSLGYSVLGFLKTAKWLFKSQEMEYWIYYNRKYGYNAAIFLKKLGIMVILSFSILVCLWLNSYVKIKNDSIEINQITALFKKEYNLDSVTKIVHYERVLAPNGNVVDKPYYAIKFDDQFIWRTNSYLTPTVKNDDKIFAYLSKAANLSIEEMEIEK